MQLIKIKDICDILNGYAFKSENYVDSGIRVIRIANVQKGYIEDNSPVFYPFDSSDIEKYMLEEDDLLISLTGNVGRVAVIDKTFLPAALNQRVACLRIKGDTISKRYIFHILNSDYFEQQCIHFSKGVAQKNMSTEWLKEYCIPLYPLETQQYIAATLDKETHTIDLCNAILEKFDLLVKSRFIEMFGDPVSNPKGWDKYPIKDCLIRIENGKSFVCSNQEREGDSPAILKLSAATYGEYLPEENKALLDDDLFNSEVEVREGDLLFTRKNTPDLVGMAAYVYKTPPKLMMPDLIFRLVPNERINPIFLWQLINCREFRPIIRRAASGSAQSMSNISKERLGKIQIICPPIFEQERLQPLMKQIDKSKLAVKQVLEKAEMLKKALMQEYFG